MRLHRALRHASLAAATLAVAATPALAGGPIFNCGSGVPLVWPSGGANVPFNPDQGPLGPLTNAEAVAAVGDAFLQWANVPSATISFTNAGLLPVDVDVTNFGPFLEPVAPDGLSAIVFDDTGEIFDLVFGPDSGILGFAGPEWIDVATCTVLEGVSFLNGPTFTNLVEASDVIVHEIGHYVGLGHSVVNGQVFFFDDATGPAPFPGTAAFDQLETMYPFYGGEGQGTSSPHRDDIAIISGLYPEPTFAGTTGSITGSIFGSNGTTRLTGVNVIARNLADPYNDAVSAISGDRTDDFSQADPLTGAYRLDGLTPGATYAVFVDEILAGGFSTPPLVPLPGPEEFHNGANESADASTDDPTEFTGVVAAAGGTAANINVIFNAFAPGDPLPVGDEDSVQLFLPFAFKMCGQEFDSVFVNSNGTLTFGEPQGPFDFFEGADLLLAGPARIAGLWEDLDASAGGVVTFDQTANSFTVIWDSVPEFIIGGSNTFEITLKRSSNQAIVEYGALSAPGGLAGLTCGSAVNSQFENEENLRRHHSHRTNVNMSGRTTAFEIFTDEDNDLAGFEIKYVNFKRAFEDEFEGRHGNNTLATATRIDLPFNTASVRRFSEINPVGGDVDYYRFRARAGDILALETVRGTTGFDSMIGLFDADTGDLLALDDDGGCCGIGGLSRLVVQVSVDINLALAVTSWPDFDFNGTDGVTGGRYVLVVNKYRGELLDTGDDTATEVPLTRPFWFQGEFHDTVFVNSNGNLSFGAGDTDFSESPAELLAGPPRIAALWDDLDATFGEGFVVAEQGSHSTTIHYLSVPQFFDRSPNYFSIGLHPFGIIAFDYSATARGDGIVGVTEGGGAADPGETDLTGRFLPIFSAAGTTYEQFIFPEPFDLSFESLFFAPFF